ncbi:MAG: MMPL family transporter [Myxococcota bacterium]|nr:MMPL family transporter [Myxococcota bacterium]
MSDKALSAYSEFVVKRPRTILFFVSILTIALAYGLTLLRLENSYDYDLPPDDPIVSTNNSIEDIFGPRKSLLIAIESDSIYSVNTLSKIYRLTNEIKDFDEVVDDEIFSLATSDNIVGSDFGVDFSPFMKTEPKTDAETRKLKKTVENNSIARSKIVSDDGTTSIILARLKKGYNQKEFYDRIQKTIKKYVGPEKIYTEGDPIMEQEIDVGIQSDMQVLLPLAIGLILVGFFLCFFTLRGVLLPFSVVVLSIIWSMGIMGFIGFPITVVTSALPMMTVAIASSYGIHVVHRYYEEVGTKSRREGTRIALKNIAWPVMLTGKTSAIGAASLIIFRINSIKEFGIIAAIAILTAVVISLTVVPAILSFGSGSKPSKSKKSSGNVKQLLGKVTQFSIKRKRAASMVFLAVAACSVYEMSLIRVGNDFIEYFPEDHHLRESFSLFNEKLGGSRTFDVVLDSGKDDGVTEPKFLQSVFELQQYIEQFDEVGYTLSYANILKHMNFEINSRDKSYDGLPETKQLISQYFLLYDPPKDFVDTNRRFARMVVMINNADQEIHKRLYNNIAQYAENLPSEYKIKVGGMLMVWIAQIKYIVTGKMENIAIAFALIFLFCALIYRSWVAGVCSVIPLSFATLTTFGLMGALGLRLDMATAIITGVAVGIGVDFAIHYILRLKEEIRSGANLEQALCNTGQTAGKAIIFDMFSNVLGFAVFMGSSFLPIRTFGWLISFTMLTVGIGTLVLLPMVISAFKPKFIVSQRIR